MAKGGTGTIERFWSKVDKTGTCWNWMASMKANGRYGQFKLSNPRRSVLTHRFAYELFNGPIPEGLVIDHICENTFCVNPTHLKATTQKNNVLRSRTALASLNSRKTHCKHGHEFTPENTRITTDGYRECKACRIEIKKRWRQVHGTGR